MTKNSYYFKNDSFFIRRVYIHRMQAFNFKMFNFQSMDIIPA